MILRAISHLRQEWGAITISPASALSSPFIKGELERINFVIGDVRLDRRIALHQVLGFLHVCGANDQDTEGSGIDWNRSGKNELVLRHASLPVLEMACHRLALGRRH